ncbi:LPXTG-motif cell wall-anchored protein [Microbacterium sp. SORGH_AS 1204]|uniref:LPXTG cell wall anchor domain-containing protein n=1 Tax=Microbacterium sp. SORGH_AS_1204 TaxID=3041785 RepID=UPI00278CC0C2|nr:LPXTG cell wall anchor domain-containing protein [Microbacterium sp. SORGH_AS_1204]MDQ1138536.1 LPXTG-motif cell wall-anchored protein [Microbacterium sp. SORGH_AS_1204]
MSYSATTPVASGDVKTLAVTGADGSSAAALGIAGLLTLVLGGALLTRRRRATV